ncbi:MULTISPECIES: hypothetical protein [unclassified Lysobacter]|uniref:hypothetical protein n=1 Tax=unclassified Lysobacter TaxID=2635362 RepID=UPI001BE81431|nr:MULTISPECIES: hypothetical protein [unclassified Lysobacter]MBT2747466.1 hypothetical protein [Lysobacter sp. ISL-42]MBT2752712.1 hypothetical protein [Lysobacter sp. ISL-50]MBT2778369.1 hypothetical protein [Lysobacter sp. ISL-54]MBT2783887.1 hypothetical protein [Lysobacter sp. ISL-52]
MRTLHALSHSGGFLRDLYYRLNVLNLHLPPLRDNLIVAASIAARRGSGNTATTSR